MATYTASAIPTIGTSANLQAWVAIWVATLTAAGWVQTADTGQTASGSFTGTASLNTSQGYQIWRMADALQGSYPIFVKFEWGTGGTTNYPCAWITIGTGSNGSGTITGVMVSRQQNYGSGTSASSLPCYGSGSTSRLTLYSYYLATTTATGMFMNIERTKDSTGADTSDGILFAFWCCGTPYGGHGYAAYGTTGKFVANMPWVASYMSGTGSDGSGTIMLMPIVEFSTYGTVNSGVGVLAYAPADLTTANQYTVAIGGGNHNYLALAGYGQGSFYNWASSMPAMLYE